MKTWSHKPRYEAWPEYHQGRADAKMTLGKHPIEICPYPIGTEERRAYMAGWQSFRASLRLSVLHDMERQKREEERQQAMAEGGGE